VNLAQTWEPKENGLYCVFLDCTFHCLYVAGKRKTVRPLTLPLFDSFIVYVINTSYGWKLLR